MQGTGNKPPATVLAKGKWLTKDIARWKQLLGLTELNYPSPSTFPAATIKAQRLLTALSSHGAIVESGNKNEIVLEKAFRALWVAYFGRDLDIGKDEVIVEALAPIVPGGKDAVIKLLKEDATSPQIKEALTARTKEALDSGAFGAPWWVIKREDGKEEVFFGSDRMEHICQFLGVPYQSAYPNGYGKPSHL